jgi:phage repressor protein C with HTH and peptisase S24 domain
MFSHDDVWRGIDRLAASFGFSASGLAKQAGLDPTSFNKSKRISPDGKPRWPSTESLAKILSVTGATMSDFISMIGGEEPEAREPRGHKIPVLGFAQAGSNGYFDDDGYPAGAGWGSIDFPGKTTAKDQRNYALEVSGNSMEPLYREGNLIIVSPDLTVRRGDRIVVKTIKGEVMAKELSRQSAGKVTLKSLNPGFEDRTLRLDEIHWMARIVWVSQ